MAPDEPAGAGGAAEGGDLDSQQWAIRRRIEDVFAKLGEKFGDLSGRVIVRIKPETTFAQIGGLREAKSIVRSFATALTDPELYRKWGITPPKGVLLYGPPGTGKSLLARALATETGSVFYHLKLMNLTSKFGPNTGELLQEILAVAKEQGKGVLFLDEANALSLEHLLPPAQAREASARLVAVLWPFVATGCTCARFVRSCSWLSYRFWLGPRSAIRKVTSNSKSSAAGRRSPVTSVPAAR